MTDKHELLPADSLINVSFQIALPAAASKSDIQDWINLHMGSGGMDNANPLARHEPEAVSEPVLSDTEEKLVEKHTPKAGSTEVSRKAIRR